MNPFKRFKHGIHIAPSYTTDPVIGEVGDIYQNSVTAKLRYCISKFPIALWTDLLILPGTNDGAPLVWNAGTVAWESSPNFTMLGDTIQIGDDLPLLIKAGDASILNTDGKNLELYSGAGNGTGLKGRAVIDAYSLVIRADGIYDPTTGEQGEIYYNTTQKQFKFHDGAVWRSLTGGAGLNKVTAVDGISTTLPTGISPVVDSYIVVDNDIILFTNLTNTGSLGGTISNVDIINDVITIIGHGFLIGMQIRFAGSLPAGLTAGTNYYVIPLDPDTFAVATSYANAISNTRIDLTTLVIGGTCNQYIENNILYRATNTLGVGGTVWVQEFAFAGSTTPVTGDSVITQQGVGFADQIGIFDGTTWEFSRRRRQFSGIDYYEESAVYTSVITDNTTSQLFSINASGSEYSIIDYSIKRGTAREVGSLYIVHDGTNSTVTGSNSALAATGVYFSTSIVGGLLKLNYTADNAGVNGVFKFILRRWSDSIGGPAGVPSYTGAPTATAPAAGSAGSIQFSDGVNLAASNYFKINTSDNAMEIGGRQLTPLSNPITLNDNQPTPATFATYPATWEFMEFEYSIERGTNRSRGRLLITNNGTDVNITDDFVELTPRQLLFSVSLAGGTVNVEYVSSSTGNTPIIRYAESRWQ
jgi:hypothetical protein